MGTTVFVNSQGASHKGSDGISIVGPDICLTQVGSAVVPIPYTNVARSGDLADGCKSVRVDGHESAAAGCRYSQSTGDEPGSKKGVASGTVGDRAEFVTYSFDVKFEGRGVARNGDLMTHNSKNTVG
ncbi:MAG: DUF4150 domain-containing protein [Desulfatitalea sp.]